MLLVRWSHALIRAFLGLQTQENINHGFAKSYEPRPRIICFVKLQATLKRSIEPSL